MMLVRSVVLLAICVVALRSQVRSIPDSLRPIDEEVTARPETDIRVLGKSREMLRDAILSGDLAKASRVLAYMDARFDSARVVALSPRERLLAEFWVGRFQRVLADPQAAAEIPIQDELLTSRYRRPRLTPENDLLLEDLLEHTRAGRTDLLARALAANVTVEEREFLRIFVTFLVGPDPEKEKSYEQFREDMNEEATAFLGQYPRTRFEPFIRQYMRIVLRNSPWGFGLGLGLGGFRFGGELDRYFSGGMSIDVWGEGTYHSLYGLLYVTLPVSGEVRTPFTYNWAWSSGDRVWPNMVILCAGYVLKVNASIIITPHVGWAYINFSQPEEDRKFSAKDLEMDFGAAVAGVNLDIPFLHSGEYVPNGVDPGYHFIRARLSIQRSSTHIPYAKGTMVLFSLSYGLYARPVEREM